MQTERRFQVLFFGIALCLVTLITGLILKNMPPNNNEKHAVLDDSWNYENLDNLLINHGKTDIKLFRRAGAWWLGEGTDSVPVHELRVRDFFSTMKTLIYNRLVGATNNEQELQIDRGQNWGVTFNSNNQKTINLSFGAIKGLEQYISSDVSPLVYATSTGVAFYLRQDPSYWIERSLWPHETSISNIISFTLQKPGHPDIVLIKKSDDGADTWSLKSQEEHPLANAQLTQWTHDMAVLESDGIQAIDPNDHSEIKSKEFTLSIKTLVGMMQLVFYAGKSRQNPWIVILNYEGRPKTLQGVPLVYTINEGKLQLGLFW